MISALTLGYGTTAVVARLLGVPPRRVRKMVARGELERYPSDLGVPLYPMWPVVKLAVLRALPGTAAELSERTGVPEASVRRALTSLCEAELAVSLGTSATRGRFVALWALTPAGVRHLGHFGALRIVPDESGVLRAQKG